MMEQNMVVKRLLITMAAIALISLAPQLSFGKIRSEPPSAEAIAALGLSEKSILVQGVERWFLVQPPSDASKAAPVLLVLHGGTQSMRRLFAENAGATRVWPELAQRENVLLLVPNAVNAETGDAKSDDQNWNDLRKDVSRESKADDVGFLLALLDWAAETYKTDPSRIYVTGASNGGIMTFRMLMEAPERFAAGAAFVAALPVDDASFRTPATPTPLMIANGTLDPLMKWQGGKIPGGRGTTRSVADTIKWWVAANRAETTASDTVRLPDRDPDDNCIIERNSYKAAPGGAPVVAYTMRGGGHNLPSAKYDLPDTWAVRRFIGPVCRDVEGVELVWKFLSAYRRSVKP
jgi:polyhydroxybutyrate depolymerase